MDTTEFLQLPPSTPVLPSPGGGVWATDGQSYTPRWNCALPKVASHPRGWPIASDCPMQGDGVPGPLPQFGTFQQQPRPSAPAGLPEASVMRTGQLFPPPALLSSPSPSWVSLLRELPKKPTCGPLSQNLLPGNTTSEQRSAPHPFLEGHDVATSWVPNTVHVCVSAWRGKGSDKDKPRSADFLEKKNHAFFFCWLKFLTSLKLMDCGL